MILIVYADPEVGNEMGWEGRPHLSWENHKAISFFLNNGPETGHEIYHAHTTFGILTSISMINKTSQRLIARNFSICRYFSFYERLKFRAQLS